MSEIVVRTNIEDFRRELALVGQKIERRIVSDGVRAAGRVFRDAAKASAPVLRERDPRRTAGTLRRSIVLARSKIVRQRGVIAYYVGVRASKKAARGSARDPFYWRFMEGGWIPRGPGNRARGGERARNQIRSANAGRRIQIPFLDPAFRRSQSAAIAAFNARVRARLETELK
jgi:HK97 gp10 family phage protein